LIETPDSGLEQLSQEYELDVKRIKHEVYKLCWYMRGGVDAHELLHNTDVEDRDIISEIVKENVETVKKTGMPLL